MLSSAATVKGLTSIIQIGFRDVKNRICRKNLWERLPTSISAIFDVEIFKYSEEFFVFVLRLTRR